MGEADQPDQPRNEDTDLPPSLQRALVDSGDYALRLRTGEVVRFTRAERTGPSFVLLFASGQPATNLVSTERTSDFPNGLEVRISDIVWCARGPFPGSPGEALTLGPGAGFEDAAQRGPGVRIPLRITRGDE